MDTIVSQIRSLILQDGLGVGDSLPTERDLCERFGCSRNTVREAMRMLKAYGIVDVRPKVGATIIDNRMSQAFELFSFNLMDVSRETFLDIQGFRTLLEVASIEHLLERMVPADIDELRGINSGLSVVQSIPEASATDFQFHTRLIAILGNKAVNDVYTIMKPVILRIMQKGKTRHTYQTATFAEHEAIVDALAARDRIAYQYRMKTHLGAGFAHFESLSEFEED